MLSSDRENINDTFADDAKFIGEFRCENYKVIRGYIGGYGDELRLYYTKFYPSTIKASLCIIHGFGEHQGRFLHIADFFAKNNFVVHLVDLRGFGYSGGARGSQTIPQLHMDIEVLLRQVSKDLPLFVYGHAMGGLLLITLIMRNPVLKIAGIITTSPMLNLPMDRKIKGFKFLMVKFFGKYLEVLQKFLNLQFFLKKDLVINTKLNPTALTKNNYHIRRCFGDRLMMPFLGVGMASSLMQTLTLLSHKRQYFKESILIVHGKEDSVSNYEDSVKFFEKCGSIDKTLKLFEHGYHEIQHDDEFEELKNLMLNWCLERIDNAQPFGNLFDAFLRNLFRYIADKTELWIAFQEEKNAEDKYPTVYVFNLCVFDLQVKKILLVFIFLKILIQICGIISQISCHPIFDIIQVLQGENENLLVMRGGKERKKKKDIKYISQFDF